MGRMIAAAVCAAATISSGSACAMKPAAATATAFARCTIAGAEKLPAELGGADAVCHTIGQAAGAAANGAAVHIRVVGTDSLAATVTTRAGRKLAEQQVAVSDRQLHRGSLTMLGKALAAQLGEAR